MKSSVVQIAKRARNRLLLHAGLVVDSCRLFGCPGTHLQPHAVPWYKGIYEQTQRTYYSEVAHSDR